ncbi:SNF2-related [Fusarium mexicanum]|uniref:SNF2-related n=1 Tax=Fusarium mexicanum TaxID=751941 RepID=A0A8H5JR30_9HYPO|nr:SNF2-related [Fusarium mexicanum]
MQENSLKRLRIPEAHERYWFSPVPTYQKEAIDFILKRETGDIPSELSLWKYNSTDADEPLNRRTNQFKAVAALSAKHRWCLTGTPIQNSMEDLGALVSFLRVPVLENAPTFYRFITSPATSSSSRDRFKNLRTLLETICLRRTREILPLKPPVTDVREVLLTDSERQEYNNLIQEGKTQLDMITSGHSKRKVSSVVLQSILKLRLFCNNGRSIDNQQFEVTGLPSDPDEALAYLQQHERNICAICSVTIYSIDNSDKTDACQQEGEPELPGVGPLQDGQASTGISGQTGGGHPMDNYPSKLLRLLEDIRQYNTQKIIVFSCWKKTLFLISALLSHHSIRYGIIHGSRTLTERTKALKEFQSKTGPTILLMTLGTGAVGLNLAVASRIYLLEPQWNPSIEEQAIGRALRLGQESQVVVVRYITAKTVEQADVVFRQRRKLQLVGGGFGKGKNAASETLVESLLHVFDDDGAST